MDILQQTDPDVLEARGGGGVLGCVGLMFLAPGLTILTSPLWISAPPKGQNLTVGIIVGLACTLVGAAIMLGRRGCVINRRRGSVLTWWGLLVPFFRKARSLDSFHGVTITKELRGGKHKHIVYPVTLSGTQGNVEFDAPRDYQDARRLAEQLAKFTTLRIADSSSGRTVVREPTELDESLRDHARRTAERPVLPPAPAGMKSVVSVVGSAVQIEVQPSGIRRVHYIILGAVLLCVCPAAFFAAQALTDRRRPQGALSLALLVGGAFIVLPLLAVGLAILSSARKRTRILASPDRLRVEEQGLMSRTVTEIPASEMEELIVGGPAAAGPGVSFGPQEGITARSDKATVTFGGGLSTEELAYIHAIIKTVLTA